MNLKNIIKPFLPKILLDFYWKIKYTRKKLPNYENLFSGKRGLEIGGPSLIFKTLIPIYQNIDSLDGVNFSNQTIWEGAINKGKNFNYFKKNTGVQYIAEATHLGCIRSDSYDFVISSNCLEHVANPLQAINEWKRVIKTGGYLLLVLPKKDSNFDFKRPYTNFDHLLADYMGNISESDMTHIDEILSMHDITKDHGVDNFEDFEKRSKDNFNNRCMHHHVFNLELMFQIFKFFDIKTMNSDVTKTDFILLGLIRK